MKLEKGKPEILTGLASNLKSEQETLPAIEVKNHVEWVNDNFNLPFFEVGKPTNLGVFLTSEVDSEDKPIILEVKSRHGRSALLGKIHPKEKQQKEEIADKQVFRDIDIKGLGYVISKNTSQDKIFYTVGDIKIDSRNVEKSMGLLNSKDAYRDKEFTEILQKYGIRTHRVIAIIGLEEVVYQGKRISITEAKAKKIMAEKAEPVLEIRAFGTHARLTDISIDNLSTEKHFREKAELFIEDARLLVAKELGEDLSTFDRVKYFKWLARTVGKNLGLLHKHRYFINLREGHNITLDGCLVDFECTRQVRPESLSELDADDYGAFTGLRKVLDTSEFRYPGNRETYDEILKEYKTSYQLNKNS
ncbi:hypothetical protein A2643_02395 [Candidatus Nomurabacteria bacterium RIFCSPHIGHO2_01_FULL_39_220]|uniref:Uncharacterized protein n=1 Tax=Candidatus Nomurabacteria bacterium RIFCSPLOWO2_02_FULL_40_67 TaxID=1801787 RepID=A0A1F6Y6Y9_9BACT|nr:MAG: hypothetical protein UU01_C0026G0004 [Parcubacteria group bacterium GW2011_GWA2_40_37]OGI61763.1 MAG: hypothetical protein A2W12_03720 [Candidatus Nomurabacteria bacterium RBG_16_40_11]OGI70575.1 MAG: hypothetical protein A2643_02395 [Candidatus Nomurabacteria bacterium RIFCSPHIGHO2_01_FULL_39_220]OGI72943.1 MAG: hypothetical protein A2W56_00555 [Candidatus Nomurabacteria bacterium RIFCSPHIGHO2_02_41_18]OGI78907.1 MAG: hypothetical protein A3C65_00925 [Candidatus Nomurabacteria bacteriu